MITVKGWMDGYGLTAF